MAQRSLRELEAFLTEHGVELEDRAFELELNSYGWRVAQERNTREGVLLRIECLVECSDNIPRILKIVSDNGYHDRDVALMRALERVLEFGFEREQGSAQTT
jgi:hypothetical protein